MKLAVLIGAAALLVVAVGYFALPLAGGFLIVSDPLGPADAILPLAGGQERVIYAAELFDQGYAGWFIATDMPLNLPGVREPYSALVKREAGWRGVPAERVRVTPETVTTTTQEAQAVRRTVEAQGLGSLLVITSPYHTRRARLIFRDVFRDTGVSVAVRPVAGHWYRAGSWWKTQDGLRETWTEYLKLGLYVMGYR